MGTHGRTQDAGTTRAVNGRQVRGARRTVRLRGRAPIMTGIGSRAASSALIARCCKMAAGSMPRMACGRMRGSRPAAGSTRRARRSPATSSRPVMSGDSASRPPEGAGMRRPSRAAAPGFLAMRDMGARRLRGRRAGAQSPASEESRGLGAASCCRCRAAPSAADRPGLPSRACPGTALKPALAGRKPLCPRPGVGCPDCAA